MIAYRTGLDITHPSAADARGAFTRWRQDGFRETRGHAKPVRDRLLERTLEVASATGVPVHIHSGGGDPDSLVPHARPAGLFDLLKRHPQQPVLLIHAGWPWTDEAAFMASILPHVYLDLSIGIPWGSLAIDRLIETALGLAPPSKVLYGSDEASEPEVAWFAAHVAREALERVLATGVERRWLTPAQATGIGDRRAGRQLPAPARDRRMTGHEALLDLIAAPDGALALVEPASGERTTYGELRATAERLARSLAAAGVGPGDAVAMSLPNGPEIVAAFLGVVAAGAAAAPLNQAYTGEEFHAYLEDLRPRAMLFLRGEESPARASCAALGVRQLELDRHAHGRARDRRSSRAAPRRRAIPRPSRCCCTRAARRASPRACRSGSATSRRPRARSRRPTGSPAATRATARCRSSTCTAWSHRRSRRSASGGSVIAPRRFSAERVLGRVRDARGDVVLGRADDPPHPALARRGGRRRPRGPRAALRALLLVGAARRR